MENSNRISIKETIAQGFGIYIKNIVNILIVDLISLVPSLVYFYLISMGKMTGSPALIMFFLIVVIALIFLNQGAVYTIFDRSYKNEPNTLGEAIKKAFTVLPGVFIVNTLYGFIIMGGAILLVIPGLVFAVKYLFSVVAVVVEDKSKGPMKLASLMAKGNFAYILIICLICIVFLLPGNFIQGYFMSNALVLFAAGLPLMLFSTIAQAIVYIAYTKVREQKAAEIETAANLKPLGETAGCFVIAAIMVLFFIVGIAAAIVGSKIVGFDKVGKIAFGSQVVLSDEIALDVPDKWMAMPGKKPFKYWLMMNMNEKEKAGINTVMFYSLAAEEGAFAPEGRNTRVKKMLSAVKAACDTYYTAAKYEHLNPNFIIPAVPETVKVKVKGEELYKMAIKGKSDGVSKNWTLYFGESAGRFVFIYYEKPADKAKLENYRADVETISLMLK